MKEFIVRINDDAAEALKHRAEANRRPFKGEAEVIIEQSVLPSKYGTINVVVRRSGEEAETLETLDA